MKRLLYILIAVFAVVSCMKETTQELVEYEGKVKVSFSIESTDRSLNTKSLSELPDVKKLYLAVFDEAGYFCEYVEANPIEEATYNYAPEGNPQNKYKYTAELSTSPRKRIIHFIGNGPSPETISFGDEVSVIAGLSKNLASDNPDAYWARKVLNKIGRVKVSEGVYQADAETKNALTDIGLIRNFARVSVTCSATNLEVTGYQVVNENTLGSIAPYNTYTGEFQSDYFDGASAEILAGAPYFYKAFVPLGSSKNNEVQTDGFIPTQVDGKPNYTYVYESRQTGSTSDVYLLIKGKYNNSNTETFYKVLLKDQQDRDFDLLRNFTYIFNISQVNKAGYSDLQSAADSDGLGDLSGVGTQPGVDDIRYENARLQVQYTDYTIVSGEENILFRYKFVAGLNSDGTEIIQNDDVDFIHSYDQDHQVITNWAKDENDADDGYREVHITPHATYEEIQKEIVTLRATIGEGEEATSLIRTVTYTLMNKYNMIVYCDPRSVAKVTDQPFDYVIGIPAGTAESLFPLEFSIISESTGITPATSEYMPVYIDGKKFGFYKTVTLQDFKNAPGSEYKEIRCHFVTIKKESAGNISASNRYFNDASAMLYNDNKKFIVGENPFTDENGTTVNHVESGNVVNFSFQLSGNLPEYDRSIILTLNGFTPTDSNIKSIGDNKYVLTVSENESTKRDFTVSLRVNGVSGSDSSVKLDASQFTPSDEYKIGIRSVNWILVTDASTIDSNKSYAIVGTNNGKMYMLPNAQASQKTGITGSEFTVYDNKNNTFKISKTNGGDYYYIRSESNNNYYLFLSYQYRMFGGTTRYINVNDTSHRWALSINNNKQLTLRDVDYFQNTNRYIGFTNGNQFNNAGSAGTNLQLYEYIGN